MDMDSKEYIFTSNGKWGILKSFNNKVIIL